jgi:hypothetical protein
MNDTFVIGLHNGQNKVRAEAEEIFDCLNIKIVHKSVEQSGEEKT